MTINIYRYLKFLIYNIFSQFVTYILLLFSIFFINIKYIINMAMYVEKDSSTKTPFFGGENSFGITFWILGVAIFSIFIVWQVFANIENSEFRLVVLSKPIARKEILLAKYFSSLVLIIFFIFLNSVFLSVLLSINKYNTSINKVIFALNSTIPLIFAITSLTLIFSLLTLGLKKISLISTMALISAVIAIISQIEYKNSQEKLNFISKQENDYSKHIYFIDENDNASLDSTKTYLLTTSEHLQKLSFNEKNNNWIYLTDFYSQWQNGTNLKFINNFPSHISTGIAVKEKNPFNISKPIQKNINKNSVSFEIEKKVYYLAIERGMNFPNITNEYINTISSIFVKNYDEYPDDIKEAFLNTSFSSILFTMQKWIIDTRKNVDISIVPEIKTYMDNVENDQYAIDDVTLLILFNINKQFNKLNKQVFNTSKLYDQNEKYRLQLPFLEKENLIAFEYKLIPIIPPYVVYIVWMSIWIISISIYSYFYNRKDLN